MAPKKNAPRGCWNNHAEGGYNFRLQNKISTGKFQGQSFNIDPACLPAPSSYYSRFFKLPKQHGRVMVNCCFHDDRTPSLSIDLTDGWFKCFGCGVKGGGIIKFHMTKHTMSFIEACRDLNLEICR